jgi:lactoylglutathione lyase
MGIKRFDHIAINSRDISKSRFFYSDILGLTAGKSVDMGDFILHYMELPDKSTVELFEYKNRGTYNELQTNEGFMKHIAFNVDNIDELNKKLKANNVKFELELCVLDLLNVRALLCYDPDGVIVELAQNL